VEAEGVEGRHEVEHPVGFPSAFEAAARSARRLARELGPRGISLNPVHPGPTDTEADPADGPNAETIAGFTEVHRCAEAAGVAAGVAHPASAHGGYLTGASTHVDDGSPPDHRAGPGRSLEGFAASRLLPLPVLLVPEVGEFAECAVDAAEFPEQVDARSGERDPFTPVEEENRHVQQADQDE
jgi:hypothetical protein